MYISEKSSINVPFSFVCVRGVAEENALLDSGATENFMDQRMVERLSIGLRPMKEPRRVFNVDGTENKHGTLTHYTLLRVKKGDKNLLQRFYVTSLGADHAIFGYPWLRDFNPNVNWVTGRVLGPQYGLKLGYFKPPNKQPWNASPKWLENNQNGRKATLSLPPPVLGSSWPSARLVWFESLF